MEKILNWINQNQWLNSIYLILAIFGIISTIYFYFKSKKQKKAVFSLWTTNIISPKVKSHGDIQVTYCDKHVENLSVTKIGFWNNGNDVINEIDQAPTDKLRIEIDEKFNILNAEIIFQSKSTNNVKLNKHDKKILIDFDYFDSNQGFIVKIIHTGLKSSNLKLRGTIKGGKEISKIDDSNLGHIQLSTLFFTLPLLGYSRISKKTIIKTKILFPLVSFIFGIILISIPFFNKFLAISIDLSFFAVSNEFFRSL